MSTAVIAGGALQRLARRPPPPPVTEKCDLCSEFVPANHRHVLESDTRSVACVCQACTLLLSQPAASLGRYRLIPRRYASLDLTITESEWTTLHVPVDVCFITAGQVYFPGPMGPTSTALDPSTWRSFTARYPKLADIEDDLEALLMNRLRGANECFVVPIDSCFELVAVMRQSWRGLTGGKQVWIELERFFDELRKRSRDLVWRQAHADEL